MHVLVVGGTGASGRVLVAELHRRGHRVRSLSRSGSAPEGAEAVRGDITTGEGLADAVRGVDAVVDCANTESQRPAVLHRHFVEGTRRLLQAEGDAGVGHHVLLSIAGARDVPWSYYRAKTAQEDVLTTSAVPGTVVPACQFHTFPALVADMAGPLRRLRVVPVPSRVRMRPVALTEVAAALADAVEAGPGGAAAHLGAVARTADVRGPREELLDDLVRRLLRSRGERALVVPVPVPGELGRRLRGGALLGDPGTPGRGPTWQAWLETASASRDSG